MIETESLHTAARRYCIERADRWRREYAPIANRSEKPARGGLLGRLGLTVPGKPREGLSIYPRYKILDAVLIEIERSDGTGFNSLSDARRWLVGACQSAYDEESRPPDVVMEMDDMLSPQMRERVAALGPKAKVVSGKVSEADRTVRNRAMKEECESFIAYVKSVAPSALTTVEPLPYRRTLKDDESTGLWSLLKARWGIDGQWYPLDRRSADPAPKDAVAFQAAPFFDKNLVEVVQTTLRRQGVGRVFELREGSRSADVEIDVGLLRPWYNFDEGFWLDDSGAWVVYASHEGSVTVAGAGMVMALKETWSEWDQHLYSASELGEEHEVGRGITSTSVRVDPPSEQPRPDAS